MKKKIILGIIFILIIGIIVCLFLLNNKGEQNKPVNKFKEEYEKYNNVEIDSLKKEVSINNEKEIKYLDADGLKTFKTGIIFLGNAKDYNSRYVVETLLSAYDKTSVKELYYYSVDNIDEVKELAEFLSGTEYIPDVIYVKEGKFVSEVKWALEEGSIDYPQPGSQAMKELYKKYFDLFSSSIESEGCEDPDTKC